MSVEVIQITIAVIAILAFSLYITSLRSRREQQLDDSIVSIISEMNIGSKDEANVKKEILGALNEIRQGRQSNSSSFINDIDWDIAGIIGVLVTITIILMLVFQGYERIPSEFFAAWTMILGYYYGKSKGEAKI